MNRDPRPYQLAVVLATASIAACGQVLDRPGSDPPPGAPAVPAARSPWNGAYTGSLYTAGALRPTFRWDPVDGATSYELALDRTCTSTASCGFDHAAVASQITATSFRPPANLAVENAAPPLGSRYYWRMRACSAAGCSGWSDTRYLNVGRLRDDFDGDGYSDVAVGTFYGSKTLLYRGSPSGLLKGMPPTPTATLAIPDLLYLGYAIAVGDFDGDGFADAALAADTTSASTTGVVILAMGGPGGLSAPATAMRVENPHPGNDGNFGISMVSPGDADGDGFDDLVIAVPTRAYFFRGSRGALGSHIELPPPTSLLLAGNEATLAPIGDIDGDGFPDLAIPVTQASDASVVTGVAVYTGSTGGPVLGTTLTDAASAQFGISLAGIDLDADGHANLLVGSLDANAVGSVSVFRGSTAGLATTPSGTPFPNLLGQLVPFYSGDGSAMFAATGNHVVTLYDAGGVPRGSVTGQAGFGGSLSVCDCSGDGYPDLVVGDSRDGRGTVFEYDLTPTGLAAAASRTLEDPTGPQNEAFGMGLSR